MAETLKQQRTRLAAGLIGCEPSEVQPQVRAMSEQDRARLTGNVDWLVDYEAAEAEQLRGIA